MGDPPLFHAPRGGERRRHPPGATPLVGLAADVVRSDDGRVVVVRFEEIPDQAPLAGDATVQSAADVAFERRTEALSEAFDVGFESRKSSTGSTNPRPIRCPQMRLTAARAKNGLLGRVSQSANT